MQRDLLRDAFFIDKFWQHLGTKILERGQENTDPGRDLNGRRAGWRYCYEKVYPDEPPDALRNAECTSGALHLDVGKQPIPAQVSPDNYISDLRDASLYGAGATLENPGISAQPKLLLADQRHYVGRLQNIPSPLELLIVIAKLRPVLDEDASSGSDYEGGIVCRNPRLMLSTLHAVKISS